MKEAIDKEALTEEEIKEIEEGLEDIRKGRVKPIGQVANGLGIKLKKPYN